MRGDTRGYDPCKPQVFWCYLWNSINLSLSLSLSLAHARSVEAVIFGSSKKIIQNKFFYDNKCFAHWFLLLFFFFLFLFWGRLFNILRTIGVLPDTLTLHYFNFNFRQNRCTILDEYRTMAKINLQVHELLVPIIFIFFIS